MLPLFATYQSKFFTTSKTMNGRKLLCVSLSLKAAPVCSTYRYEQEEISNIFQVSSSMSIIMMDIWLANISPRQLCYMLFQIIHSLQIQIDAIYFCFPDFYLHQDNLHCTNYDIYSSFGGDTSPRNYCSLFGKPSQFLLNFGKETSG